MMMKSQKSVMVHHSRWTGSSDHEKLHSCPRCASGRSASCSSSRALRCLHDLAKLNSTPIGHCGDERVDERVRALLRKKAITISQQLLSSCHSLTPPASRSPGTIPAENNEDKKAYLVEENSNSGLDEQVHSFEREVPVKRCAFHEWRRKFECQREDRHHHRDYLHQRDLDDYVKDWIVARVGTVGVAYNQFRWKWGAISRDSHWDGDGSRRVESMVNEVEEELAVEESPECCPDQVYMCRSEQTSESGCCRFTWEYGIYYSQTEAEMET